MIGSELNIDSNFLKTLEKVDKIYADLIDKNNTLSRSAIEAFNKISSQGVDPFLEKLRQQKNALEAIASIDLGSKPTSEMRKLVKSASGAVDEINRVINALQGASTQMDVKRAAKSVDSEIKKETDSYLKNLDEQIQARQKYLLRQEEIEQKRVKISQDAEKQVENEIKKETDAYLKDLEKRIKGAQEYEQRMIALEESRVRAQKQQLTDYANYELNQLSERLAKHKSYGSQLLANDTNYHNQRQAMYEKLFSLQAKYQAEAGALLGRVYARTGGAPWDIQGEDVIRQNQADLKSRRDYINERTKMYEQMFDEISRREKQALDDFRNYEKSRLDDSLEQYKRNKQDQANVDKHYHNQRQREYDEMFAKIDELAKRESVMRSKAFSNIQSHGDTSRQAEAAYNRLYGDKGVKSINNMNRALQRLQDAQNKLNLSTDKGRQKYDELGKKIQQIKRDLDKATQANEKFHNSHSKLLNTTDQLQRKLALLFSISAIQGYMDKLVNVRKEFELQQKSLQVLLRDKDQADKLWQQTIDLAVKSPFRVSQLVSYTKQLAAYRIESDKLYDTTKMLSDVSAGLGVDMQRIILAFGQVRTANFLRGTELRQFTEAGIPMLDELAQMFTELEGRAVKAGDVFERISKRMVTFRDVEEVFKRMTSSSGVFYNMQEEQSKTLFGMISNLHDSIDLMLNDIGRSNDGVIKDMVSLTRDLVENWRGVATVLKQVGVTLAMIGLAKFVTGWRIASTAIATGSTSAALAMNGMAGSAARLRIAMSILGKTISANPWFLLVGVVASAGHALWEYVEAIDAANAKYDDMSRREIAHIDRLEELQKKTEQYNATIEDGKSSEQARNQAQLENDKILSQIKAKYPELYPLIVKQTNGTIDLTKAIEEQNEKLIENIALQQKAKGGFFQETLDENYKESIDAFGKLESSLSNFKVVAMEAQSKLGQALHDGLISQGDYDRFSELLSVIRKSKDFKQLHKAFNDLTSAIVRNGKEVTKQVPLLGMFANEWVKVVNSADSYKDALDDLRDNFKNQKNILKVGIQDAFDEAGGGESGAKAAGEYISSFLDKFNIVDKNIRKWAEEEIPKLVEVKFDVIYPTKETTASELEPWAKRVKDAIENINNKIKASNKDVKDTDLFPIPEPWQMREQYLNVANAVLDVAKATYREGQKIVDDNIVKQTKMLKPFASEVEAILNIDDKNKGNGKGKDWMSEVVKGIKEAHQEYIKLNKTLEDSEAKQLALNKYAKSFAESAKNAGLKDISLGQFKFETEEGAIEALTFLKNKLPQSAKQARFKLEEAIGEIRGEVRIRTKAEDDKLLIEQIEDMFSGYEMSIELQKLNIPPDLAKQLFNIDTLTLPELKSKVVSMESQFVGTDMEEEYRKFLKKIDEMEDEQRMVRLKKFVKFLKDTSDEIAKVQNQGALDISYAQNLFMGGKIDAQEYSQIIKHIVNEVNNEVSKINLEKFKESPEYIAAMGDMAGYTVSELSKLSNKIRELIAENAKSMTPDEIKAYNDALNKINEQINKIKSPFGKSWVSDLREINSLEKELTAEKEKQVQLQNKLLQQQSSLSVLTKKLEDLQSQPQSAGRDLQIQGVLGDIQNVQKGISQTNGQLNTTAGNISNIGSKLQGLLKGMGSSVAVVDKIIQGISQSIGATIQMFNDFKSMMDSFGVDTDKGAWQDISIAMETLGEVNQKATQGWEDLKSGNIAGAVANTVGVVTSLISGINKIHDAKYERRIQRETEFVENLQHAYEKLGKAVEDAYSIDTLERSGKNAKANLQSQIQSYYKMIDAEEDKKDTDDDRIKEWKYQIEELKQQIEDLNKDLVSTATAGILDSVLSASQEFTNAWLEAFNETGDGLSGLESNFKETMLEMVKQQAAMLISQSYVEKWKKQLEQYINPDDLELSTDEASKWVDAVTTSLPQLNQALENYFNAMKQAGVDLSGGEQAELSGLQRGIQELHESTGQEIAAYLNSIRFFVAEQTTYLSQIASSFGNTEMENPMVSELKTQTEMIRAIRDMFSSVIRNGHPTFGGAFIKVAL